MENPQTGWFIREHPMTMASINGATPSSLDGLFQGKSGNNMDENWWYSHDYGNPHMGKSLIEKPSLKTRMLDSPIFCIVYCMIFPSYSHDSFL